MSMNNKKPCIRCLLKELGEEQLLDSVYSYRASIPEEEQTECVEYDRRLEICKQCDWLNQGVCGKCGCFVEARAYRKSSYCPHEHPRW